MSLLPRVPPRFLAWFLACTLLLAQMLGLMHGLVHGPQAQVHAWPTGQQHPNVHRPDRVLAPETSHGASWLAPLFPLHDGDSDCRLFDQASHGHAAPGMASLSLPMVLSSRVFDISRGEALARWVSLFDARGPPLTR